MANTPKFSQRRSTQILEKKKLKQSSPQEIRGHNIFPKKHQCAPIFSIILEDYGMGRRSVNGVRARS